MIEPNEKDLVFRRHKIFLTYSQCPENAKDLLEFLKSKFNIRYYLIAHEFHKDDGEHLHCYLHLHKKIYVNLKKEPRMFDFKGYHPNVRRVFKWEGLVQYCEKDGDWIANFDIKCRETHTAMRNQMILEDNLNDLVRDGEIRIESLPSLKKAKELFFLNEPVDTYIPRKCFWVHGDTRVGKSFLRVMIERETGKKCYPKPCNKWWDGYTNEDIIFVEDVDPENKMLSHKFKLWFDNYSFIGESKNGSVYPRYTKAVVTSQYYIEEIFDDKKVVDAMNERFKTIELVNREGQQKCVDIILGKQPKKKKLVKSKFYITK